MIKFRKKSRYFRAISGNRKTLSRHNFKKSLFLYFNPKGLKFSRLETLTVGALRDPVKKYPSFKKWLHSEFQFFLDTNAGGRASKPIVFINKRDILDAPI